MGPPLCFSIEIDCDTHSSGWRRRRQSPPLCHQPSQKGEMGATSRKYCYPGRRAGLTPPILRLLGMEKTAPKSSSMPPAKSERRDGCHLQSILQSKTSRRLDSSHIARPRDGEGGANVLLYDTSQVRKERSAPPPEHIAIQDVAPARLLPYCAFSGWRRYHQGGPLCRQPSREGEMGAAAISILPSMAPQRWTVSSQDVAGG
jgi:hypothetical protein